MDIRSHRLNIYSEHIIVESRFEIFEVYITTMKEMIGICDKEKQKYSVCEDRRTSIKFCTIFKILCSLVFFISFVISGYITIQIGATDAFERYILKNLEVVNGTPVFEVWKNPDAYNLVHVYPFNYTNVEEVLKGNEKLKVEEVGPYVFKEINTKTNVQFENEELVTYTENRTHEFLPELSNGNLNDFIIAPNVPVISAISKSLSDTWINQKALKILLSSYGGSVFSEVDMNDFILGSDGDRFSVIVRQLSSLFKNEKPPRFGILAQRTGLGVDRITIATGVNNLDRLGEIHVFNGKQKLEVWSTDECNNLTGSDGSLFPGRISGTKNRVYIFSKSLCRRIPLNFIKETKTIDGYPVRRFALPNEVYASGDINPENACFCQEDCPPSGTFSISPCNFDAPIVLSYPHFLHGDPILTQEIDGLNPIQEKHEFYLDIHSTLGLPLSGHSRFQIGIEIPESPFNHEVTSFRPGMVLPIAWVDIEVGELSGKVSEMLYEGTYTAARMKWFFGMSALSAMLLSLLAICVICLKGFEFK